ncbi:dihydrofolate reductase [Falsarthrobacter nasiphocae]|uniref:Dihydrofolate reductase n=1 Tax=Falsarthrobacter nasiphocae TaxID=189863 RepID=A0AAE3YIQ6_9MICC|nr:dihydrofolate reductase [Falsarthrobacter nasiphocae]MDR6892486.1 dihydrofolate reductase [Falsarthrobacter nasiphocae]
MRVEHDDAPGGAAPAAGKPASAGRLGLIWAQARKGVIGNEGGMPWRVPEDMRHFVEQTTGHPVIMGRRTWESIPARYRPFADRTNIVITRTAGFEADGAVVVGSLEEALEEASRAPGAELTWVVGGGQVYAEALPRADLAVVTELDLDTEGDTVAPELGPEWRAVSAEPAEGWHESTSGIPYRILTHERRS